jgi:translation elongation factor EF-1beta
LEAWAPERPLTFGTKRKLEEKIVMRDGMRGTAIVVTAEEMTETVAGETTETAVTKTAMMLITITVEDTKTDIENLQDAIKQTSTDELTIASVRFP